MRIAVVFFLIIAMVSCKRECTKVIDTYENGKQKEVHKLNDCNDSTTYTRLHYYENGQLSSEAEYVKSKGNGQCKSWYVNGIQSAEWELLNGKQNGSFKCWDESGKLYREGNTKNGERHGTVNEWFDDGVYTNREYKNGLRDGHSYETGVDSIENKRYIAVGTYSKDKKEGLWKWFLGDSVLSFTKTYKEGLETGEYKFYYPNGHVEYSGMLENNQCVGEWKFYDTTGRLTELRYYDKGKRVRAKKL